MKTKFLMFILAAMAAVFCFSSCSKENQFNYPLDTLCGTWEGTGVKIDNKWVDLTLPVYDDLNFSITFHSDGTYYGRGYFGNGSGTYKAFGNTIETYIDNTSVKIYRAKS